MKYDSVEIDDGTLVVRIGPVSITVSAEYATVFNADKEIPASRINLSYDSFFEDADKYFTVDEDA